MLYLYARRLHQPPIWVNLASTRELVSDLVRAWQNPPNIVEFGVGDIAAVLCAVNVPIAIDRGNSQGAVRAVITRDGQLLLLVQKGVKQICFDNSVVIPIE